MNKKKFFVAVTCIVSILLSSIVYAETYKTMKYFEPKILEYENDYILANLTSGVAPRR